MDRVDQNYHGMIGSSNAGGAPMEGVKYGAATGNVKRIPFRDVENTVGSAAPCYGESNPKKLSGTAMNARNVENFLGRPSLKRIAIEDKKPERTFAASLKNRAHSYQLGSTASKFGAIGSERQLNPLSSVPFRNDHSSDAIAVDDWDTSNDLPLPMIDEIEEMVSSELEEVEMEDLEENLPNIDSCDFNNPLAVVEYVEDIYKIYRQTESSSCVSPNYMSDQFDINEKMRAILIDWLIEVHYKFELMDQTLFLTVNIVDRFLERQPVLRKKLQLVGVTAMLLASKYEEVCVPVVEDLVLISDRAYTREEVLEMERLMVNTLQFNMSVPTPYVFMRRFLKAAESDKKNQLELLSFYLIELSLVEYQMLKFKPSILAAAAVYTAQCTLKGFRSWSALSELHAKYTENELLECSRMMVEFHKNAGQGRLTGVYRKYSTSKYGYSARSEPAQFLLDSVP